MLHKKGIIKMPSHVIKKAGKGVHNVIVNSKVIGFITTERQSSGGFLTTFFPGKGVKGPRITEATSETAREAIRDRQKLGAFAKSQLKESKPKTKFKLRRPKLSRPRFFRRREKMMNQRQMDRG